jgi:hypothetical protein
VGNPEQREIKMKEESTFDKYMMPIFLIGLLIIGFVWVGKTIYEFKHPEPQQEIKFNVVGIVNATNSSIVTFQFECVKFCANKFYEGGNKMDSCFGQCEKLGK